MTSTAKVFKNGNSSAVRLPAEFGLKPGDEMVITKVSSGMFTLVPKRKGLGHLVEILQSLPDDFMAEGRDNAPPQERDWAAFDWPPELNDAPAQKP